MPIRAVALHSGIYQPSDLDVLQRAFDRIVVPEHTPVQRESIATRLIAVFSSGVTDEAELVARFRN